ncbi:MAG: PC4/YdbC family ssDNA-binding protein [Oscillospiraceae bacterium]|nr:PC4/YdbC family ssDNA-binding protein [Oscillospiraceae bacterium]
MADFNFEITKELGVISENARGWTLELNMVSFNEKEPKYDIRTWSPGHERMGKGVSLSEEEMVKLVELWNDRDSEDEFE